MAARRTLLRLFSLANNAYINSIVSFYTVDSVTKERQETLATLYSDLSGSGTVPNPYTLDGDGKLSSPVYHDVPVIAVINESQLGQHETGIIQPISSTWRDVWESGLVYYPGELVRDGVNGSNTQNVYVSTVEHLADVWSTDLAALDWELVVDVATINSDSTNATNAAAAALASQTAAASSATTASTQAATATTQATASAASASQAAASAAAISSFKFAVTTGSANAYVATFSPTIAPLSDGQIIRLELNFANSGATTLNVDGTGAVAIKKLHDQATESGDFESGMQGFFAYDSSVPAWQFLGPVAQFPLLDQLRDVTAPSPSSADVLSWNGSAWVNTPVFVDLANKIRSYENYIIYRSTVANTSTDQLVLIAVRAFRLYNIKAVLTAGSCTVALKKNGSSIGGLSAVSVTTSQTATAVNDSSNAYKDFAAGDVMRIAISSTSSAADLVIGLDMTENF